MPANSYLTAPLKSTRMPRGIPYIVGNEAAERFSFYGMSAILVIFMTKYLTGRNGALATMTDDQAKSYYHLFVMAVYFFPVAGAILSDAVLGKYRTILFLSVIYCLGHFCLALDATRVGLFFGLTLVAMGSGGIKPCVSANVGDQFGVTNQHLLPKAFAWFYFAINIGSSVSTLLIPELLRRSGPHVAFGVPGLLMFIATWVFWLGRKRFVHIPPAGASFVKEVFSLAGLKSLRHLLLICLFVAMFWSLYHQIGSAWVLQAEKMDRHWLGREWLPEQAQALNPILILLFIPLFSYVIYPGLSKVIRVTALGRISFGLFLMVLAFLIPYWVERQIAAGLRPNIIYQAIAYVLLTAAEVLVSMTYLEFSYTQAPRKMKSLVMAIYLGAIALGNAFTAAVNLFIQNPDGSSKLSGASYYGFFAAMMCATAFLFLVVAARYKEQTFMQDEIE